MPRYGTWTISSPPACCLKIRQPDDCRCRCRVSRRTAFRIGLRVGDQLTQIRGRHRRMDRENQCTADQAIDGAKIVDGIAGIFRGQGNDDLRAAVAKQQRIAVGLLARDRRSAPIAPPAPPIYLHEGRPKQRRHLVHPGTPDLVPRSAGSVRKHQANGTRRIISGLSAARDRRQRRCAR